MRVVWELIQFDHMLVSAFLCITCQVPVLFSRQSQDMFFACRCIFYLN